jgi:hypothetical protein
MKRILVIILLGIGICTAGWSRTGSAEDLNQIYKKGIKAHQDKDYATFLQCFEKLDKLLPNHPVIMYNLAGAYSLNNKKNEAIRCLKKLIVIDANPKITSDNDFNFIRESEEFKHILKQVESLNKPISTSEVAFTIKKRDLHPESIAYDPMKKTFYLSSVHKRKIVYIDRDGSVKDFTTPAQDGLDAVLGIRIDAQNRVLWAASSAFPQMTGYNEKQDKGRTAVFKYHLDTKKLIKKYVLHEEPDQNHGFDDVVIHPNGDVYISDTRQIYRIPVKSSQLESFLQYNEFLSMQGLDFCDNGKKMLAADWVKGLYLIDIDQKKVLTKVGHPENISLIGIDGLYYLKDSNSLIAIQNGINPLRVVQFYLSSDFSKVVDYKIIERANPAFNEPTLGVVVNRKEFYYIGNSQWKGYTKDFKILPFDKLQDIVIFKTAIKPLK